MRLLHLGNLCLRVISLTWQMAYVTLKPGEGSGNVTHRTYCCSKTKCFLLPGVGTWVMQQSAQNAGCCHDKVHCHILGLPHLLT